MKTVSIRTSLLRNFVLLILVLSITILLVTIAGARWAVRDVTGRLIEQSADLAEDAMGDFFGSIEQLVSASRAWWNEGLIDYQDRADLRRLNTVFIPMLDQHRQITSMMLCHDEGFEYLLFRDLRGGDIYEWYNRITWTDRGPDAGYEVMHTRDRKIHHEGPLPEEARAYDPRGRPFYAEADSDDTYWTDPYYFFITKDAGLTVSYKWRDPASGQVRLVGFDLLLMDLSRFTTGLRPSLNGKVFVMHEDGSILGLPADERWAGPEAIRDRLRDYARSVGDATDTDRSATLMTADDLELPTAQNAISSWRSAETEPGLFRFTSQDESWWGRLRPFELHNQTLWIGVVVPEKDILGQARKLRNLILLICGVAILSAVAMTGFLAQKYSRPLESLARQTARVRNLDLTDSVPVVSGIREVNQLAIANAQMMTALDSFARYLPLDLVRELLRRGEVAKIGGRAETLTVLFSDIEGFTPLAESMAPDALTLHMAEYFSALLEILHQEHATVDKFIGDAIVAFWGAPVPDDQHAAHAVRSVIRCRDLLRELNATWEGSGRPRLHTRFGLNTGEAVVGNVGAPDRLNYTVLGDTVNTASRLEGLNARYGTEVLVTEAVVKAAGDGFSWRLIDEVAVKGRARAFKIYQPLGESANVSAMEREQAACYEAALEFYGNRSFADALTVLQSLLETNPGDGPAIRLRDLCAQFVNEAPEGAWDGITRYDRK